MLYSALYFCGINDFLIYLVKLFVLLEKSSQLQDSMGETKMTHKKRHDLIHLQIDLEGRITYDRKKVNAVPLGVPVTRRAFSAVDDEGAAIGEYIDEQELKHRAPPSANAYVANRCDPIVRAVVQYYRLSYDDYKRLREYEW